MAHSTPKARKNISNNRRRCLHCLEPCDVLFRRIGEKDLKLAICDHCNKIVDPYCERELFLVALDLVLLRQHAYRHVMYNIDLSSTDLSKLLLSGSMLRAHIGMVARQDRVDIDETFTAASCFVKLAVISAVTGVCSMSILTFLLGCFAGGTEMSFDKVVRVHLFPTSFLAAVATIHFWENTETVRTIGSSLIITYRWIFTFSLLRANRRRTAWACILLGGLLTVLVELSLSAMTTFLWSSLSGEPLPCHGIELSSAEMVICLG